MTRQDVIREVQERYGRTGQSLNELQRRHWAALEAIKLGRGGITIVSQALRISPNTIKRGIKEISSGQSDSDARARLRIRKPGGGRKSKDPAPDPFATTNTNDDTEIREPQLRSDKAGDECQSPPPPLSE